ncbi:histidine kinase [Lysobacter antibioticus]|uniref:Histidine kinase-, DNA gyrase B-, and HSP90-like ATPase family protein n=1 Tax=Lysobacter antibioticus TaxID=84531 RepID=A0A0S2FE21_LYSAN|nr:histidine kinase-, DNA gyrase B-, and HSP90-like ATPase family protein [Lysobacter antibioticus]
MIRSFFFILRLAAAWFGVFLLLAMLSSATPGLEHQDVAPLFIIGLLVVAYVVTNAFSHLRRVRLIAGHVDRDTLANRHRRQIEVPFEAGEVFDLLDAAIRELPRVEDIESARDSLQVSAKVQRPNLYGRSRTDRQGRVHNYSRWTRNQILATVTPGEDSGSITLICEPETGAWSDWFRVDGGTNLENAEAVVRAISRRIAERRRTERVSTTRTVTEKELAVAKLSLLHAQVEPHFLYNTLASAQYLTRNDPPRADIMLGHLIDFLRRSLPRTEDAQSTLGDELDRSRAYLEILKLRMGARLALQIDVPEELRTIPLPPMMLQTLVENAIKHGLEPKPGGGTVWILARRNDHRVAITVADDGEGFNSTNAGTGIGLRNVRERLQLVYGGDAQLAVVANFPNGVAATISVPLAAREEPIHV